jgi:hypothetical protein
LLKIGLGPPISRPFLLIKNSLHFSICGIFAFAILKEHQMFNGYFYLGIGLIFLAVFIQMRREKNDIKKAV